MDQYKDSDITKLSEAVAQRLHSGTQKVATVHYAGELTKAVRSNLEEGVRAKFSDVTDIQFKQNDALIAGFRVEYMDMVIDASVLEKIRTYKGE